MLGDSDAEEMQRYPAAFARCPFELEHLLPVLTSANHSVARSRFDLNRHPNLPSTQSETVAPPPHYDRLVCADTPTTDDQLLTVIPCRTRTKPLFAPEVAPLPTRPSSQRPGYACAAR